MPDTAPPVADPVKLRFLQLVETAQQYHPGPPSAVLIVPDPEEEEDETRPARRRRQKEKEREERGGPRLLALLNEAPLHLDLQGGTLIEIEGNLYPLNAKDPFLFEKLSSLYFRATGQMMGRDSLANAVAVLSHDARERGTPAIMANRAAIVDGALLLDLGNNRTACLVGGSCKIIQTKLGNFRDSQNKRPHPDPVFSGNPSRLFEFVNISQDQWFFVLATLAACMVPNIARPVLFNSGPQGSGKSTASRYFKMIIDPSYLPLIVLPRKIEDFDLIAMRSFFLSIDNLSNMSPEFQDFICALVTGAGIQRRILHTTGELMTLIFDLTLCFSSITSFSNRPDFLERCLRIQLERIEAIDNLDDDELDQAFDAALPEILGGLLSMLAKGLDLLPNYRPPRLPRMANFSRIAAAIAEAQEEGAGARYLGEFWKNQGAQHMEIAEGNSFFSAILECCARGDYPEGNYKQVVAKLKEIAQPDAKEHFPTSNSLKRAVERLRVPLETAGIGFEIDNHRTAKERARIRFFAKIAEAELATAPPVDPAALADLSNLTFDAGELD